MLGLLTQGHWCSLKSSCVFTLDIAPVSNYAQNEAFLDDSIWNFTLFSEIHSISFPLFVFIWNIIGWIIDWLCTVLSVILHCIKMKVLSALAIYLTMYRMALSNKHTISICWIVKRLLWKKSRNIYSPWKQTYFHLAILLILVGFIFKILFILY